MSVKVSLRDGRGSGNEVKVTSRGELVVGSSDISESYYNAMSSINTAYNFVPPRSGERFYITGIILDADRNVSNSTPASIVVYEASSTVSTTVDKTIINVERLRNTSAILTNLNLAVSEGKYLNAKTDDGTINATLIGYYVPA